MVDTVLKFDGKDCNYVIRRSQILFGVATNRTRGNRCKLEHGKVQSPIKIFFFFFPPFTVRVVRYWNRLPKEVAESLSLEYSKRGWMKACSNWRCFDKELRLHELPSHTNFSLICSVILCHIIFHLVCEFT